MAHEISCSIRNAYYDLGNQQDIQLLNEGIALLKHFDHFEKELSMEQRLENICGIEKALLQIETAKINLLVRITQNTLTQDPNKKVVICVNYVATIDTLMMMLSSFKPLKLDDMWTMAERQTILDQFQANNNHYRLIIVKLTFNGRIDLDDKYGQFPRLCLANPSSASHVLAIFNPFHRDDTKSSATIHFVLCKEASENDILDAMARNVAVFTGDRVVYQAGFETWMESKQKNF
jgi:hypothetical protein